MGKKRKTAHDDDVVYNPPNESDWWSLHETMQSMLGLNYSDLKTISMRYHAPATGRWIPAFHIDMRSYHGQWHRVQNLEMPREGCRLHGGIKLETPGLPSWHGTHDLAGIVNSGGLLRAGSDMLRTIGGKAGVYHGPMNKAVQYARLCPLNLYRGGRLASPQVAKLRQRYTKLHAIDCRL